MVVDQPLQYGFVNKFEKSTIVFSIDLKNQREHLLDFIIDLKKDYWINPPAYLIQSPTYNLFTRNLTYYRYLNFINELNLAS